MRDFNTWLATFKDLIATYDYYVDFEKVVENADKYRLELNLLNAMIGKENAEEVFRTIYQRYPETIKCIPILLAVRQKEIYARDTNGEKVYNFSKCNMSVEDYIYFMRKTGLFNLISNHLVNNLYDYVIGVETGLDSNGRKNRGGHLMEDLVEEYIKKLGIEYRKEMRSQEIEETWGYDLSAITNHGETTKRFDFVVKTENDIYAIETNFYTASGSKLNETARSYKELALSSKKIDNFHFVWITDGKGWTTARHNLKETFDVLEHLYCINDLDNGILEKVFI